ncbi:MAG: AI-2E family transporter [Bacilli bacterium]|nr:AI-2E family transporter [Bacilli bacterium]
MKLNINTNNLLKILLLVLIIISSIFLFTMIDDFLGNIFGLLIPFIVAFTISFIVQPYILLLEKKGVKHNYAVFIIISILLTLIIIFSVFLVPLLEKEIFYFIDNIPNFITKVEELYNQVDLFKKLGLDFNQILEIIFSNNEDYMSKIIKFVNAIFSAFIPTITTPILIIYFIAYYENIENYIKNMSFKNQQLFTILKQIKYMLQEYFKSYFIITFLLTIISSICFAVLKIDYFIIWGIIIGITNIIPYVGPYIGGGIVGLFVLTTNPNILIYVIIIIICLQFIESNFLTPKIQENFLQINPILVVFSITFFGKLLGIFGMIIAVPIIRVIQIVVNVKKIDKKR